MAIPSKTSVKMRELHRYLGFFLAGIMAIYAVSGMVLIYRDSPFLKNETAFAKTIALNVSPDALGKELGIKNLRVEGVEAGVISFRGGTYDANTGEANWVIRELPVVLKKLTDIHKAKSADPLYYLNLFFGASLLFFVVSSFWMFMPGTKVFKKGLWFTLGGMVLVLVLLFV